MDLTEIAPHIYRLGVPTSGVFLLLDERITIVDTGPRWGRKRILKAIRELGRDPAEIERIVLTHAHFDHIGSLAAFRDHEAPERHAHPVAAKALRRERKSQATPWPWVTWIYHYTLGRLLEPRSDADYHLEEGDVLPVLGGMRTIHTPGHTDGHLSLLLEEHGVLLSGDALQVRGDQLTAPLVFGDRVEARRSVARLAGFEFETLAPSHFDVQRDEVRARVTELAASMAAGEE
jgi:glyoxylase-like metal-dependent hydrolase (beta-lactamase superfamily II)